MIDRDKLRKLAMAAASVEQMERDDYEWVGVSTGWARTWGDYIAAVSPEVVLALLDRIEKLEKGFADLANMTPYRITGEALTPTQLRELIEQIARQAETILSKPTSPSRSPFVHRPIAR